MTNVSNRVLVFALIVMLALTIGIFASFASTALAHGCDGQCEPHGHEEECGCDDITVMNNNEASVSNTVSSKANTGKNDANGGEGDEGGDGGDGGDGAGDGGEGGEGGEGGDGGDGGNGGRGGDTGDDCGCNGHDWVIIPELGDQTAGNGGTGGDGASAGEGGDGAEGGDGGSTGEGGDGGDGGEGALGGIITTGHADSWSRAVNVVNRNMTRVRR